MFAIKVKIDAGFLLLDDIQLDEEHSSTDRYATLSKVKEMLMGAKEMTKCRLDLIEKIDASWAEWSAAASYKKTYGLKLKPDSSKLWAEAEKCAREVKKKTFTQKAPFCYGPAQSSQYQGTLRG